MENIYFSKRGVGMGTYRSNSLTIQEQDTFLSVVDTYEDLALFKLALTSGIRREDITKIELNNVDLEKGSVVFWEAKKRRFWTIPLTPDTTIELKRYINTLPKGSKLLFNFTGRTAYNKLQRYLEKANIKKHISFHDLRRTFMKTAKRKGISLKAVSQITGDTYSVIERHYQNLDLDELKEELEKL